MSKIYQCKFCGDYNAHGTTCGPCEKDYAALFLDRMEKHKKQNPKLTEDDKQMIRTLIEERDELMRRGRELMQSACLLSNKSLAEKFEVTSQAIRNVARQ